MLNEVETETPHEGPKMEGRIRKYLIEVVENSKDLPSFILNNNE